MYDIVPRRENHPARRGDYFGNLFDSFFDHDFFAPLSYFGNNFRVDMRETKDAYIVEADLPGVKKGDITVEYNNDYLTISARRTETQEAKDESYLRRERRYGQFHRTFFMTNVDDTKIDAKFSDGVLTVHLPKREPEPVSKRTIQVH